MFITKITAENFKQFVLVQVDLDAEGGVTTISGPNGAGKTSIIDALAVVIAGRNAPKIPHPIRKGQDAAQVIAETSDGLIITRRYRRRDDDSIETTLEITNSAGMVRKSPQALLDTFLAGYALDPSQFELAKPADQVATLLEVIPDLPFVPAVLDAQFEDVFGTRTVVSRQVKELTAQLAGMPKVDTPHLTEQSAAELLAELDDLTERAQRRAASERAIEQYDQLVAETELQIEELTAKLARTVEARTAEQSHLAALPAIVEDDEAVLRQRIQDVDQVNADVRANKRRAEVADELAAKAAREAELTEEIESIRKQRTDGIAAATLPYPGLGFGDEGVTLDGVPFSQASGAQRLVAATAIAGAANPQMQLVLIRDGSKLDSTYMGLLNEYALANELRVLVEVVDEHAESGVIFREGQIV